MLNDWCQVNPCFFSMIEEIRENIVNKFNGQPTIDNTMILMYTIQQLQVAQLSQTSRLCFSFIFFSSIRKVGKKVENQFTWQSRFKFYRRFPHNIPCHYPSFSIFTSVIIHHFEYLRIGLNGINIHPSVDCGGFQIVIL